jgi:hypothetical protein
MGHTETIQAMLWPDQKIEKLTELQKKLDKKKITLIEFEEKRMEIDKKWLR